MTNAPHLLNNSRTGIRYGSAEMLDHYGLGRPDQSLRRQGDGRVRRYRLRHNGYDRAAGRRLFRGKRQGLHPRR